MLADVTAGRLTASTASLAVALALALLALIPGRAPARADDPLWLKEINKYRVASGVAPVTVQPAWTAGLVAHFRYLDLTPPALRTGEYENDHAENPKSPYYTEAGAAAANSSDLAEGDATDLAAIDGWLTAPFHATWILQPGLRQVAFARDEKSGRAGLDVVRGMASSVGPTAKPVLFPGPGMTTDLSSFGGENPDPLETCRWTGGEAGLPVIALLTAAPSPQLRARLDGPGGSMTGEGGTLCVVTPSTFRTTDTVYGPTAAQIVRDNNAVYLFPKKQLVSGDYHVTIVQPGAADVAWSFTVDRDPKLVLPSTGTVRVSGDLKAPIRDSRLGKYVFSVVARDPDERESLYDWRRSTIEVVPLGSVGACPAGVAYRRCKSSVRALWPGETFDGEDDREHVGLDARFTLRDVVSGFSCASASARCDVLKPGAYRLTVTLRGDPIPGGKPIVKSYTAKKITVDAT